METRGMISSDRAMKRLNVLPYRNNKSKTINNYVLAERNVERPVPRPFI